MGEVVFEECTLGFYFSSCDLHRLEITSPKLQDSTAKLETMDTIVWVRSRKTDIGCSTLDTDLLESHYIDSQAGYSGTSSFPTGGQGGINGNGGKCPRDSLRFSLA